MIEEKANSAIVEAYVERLSSPYLYIALAIILVIAVIAFFAKKKAVYPVAVGRVIGPSLCMWIAFSVSNMFSSLTWFIVFCVVTLLWILFLALLSLYDD